VRFSAPVILRRERVTGALNTIAREAFSLSRYLLKWSILAPLCVMQRKETSMDRERWAIVMDAVHRACRVVKYSGRTPRYASWLIVAMYLWSVMHDRCLSWACDRGHYGGIFRPRGKLPSISQFTRRVNSDYVQAVLKHVHDQLVSCGIVSARGYLDGKPLLVSAVSKDPDAKRGKISGGFAKGYKLHAYINEHRRIVCWSVMGLNEDEKTVALEMCDYIPASPSPDAMILADSNYDAHPLHRKMDQGLGMPLLTPLRAQQRVGPQGHHPVTLRQMGEQRRAAVALWETNPGLAHYLLKSRNNAEGVFSVLSVACGLSATLASFVRRLHRVRRWVGAKIILYHARLLAQEKLAAVA
jgi:hypothetical protein